MDTGTRCLGGRDQHSSPPSQCKVPFVLFATVIVRDLHHLASVVCHITAMLNVSSALVIVLPLRNATSLLPGGGQELFGGKFLILRAAL